MKKLSAIAVVGALPLLAGCFDLEQGLSVESDGTATFVSEIAMDTETMNMIAAMGEGEAEPLCTDIDADDLPDSFEVTSEEFMRDNDTVCRTVAVGPIDELVDAMAVVVGDDEGQETTLVAEGNGVYVFNTTLTSEDAGLGDMGDPEVMALFEDRTVTFFVTAPNIIETNGEVDGNTATLVIPTLDLMSETGNEYSLFVRFGL